MKITTIIGARPQFIKASAVSRAILQHNVNSDNHIREVIIHTGQHFDKNMSDVFFTEFENSKPDYNLEISNLSHGAMTGRMLEAIEKVLYKQQPDLVLIYGDTNSTLSGALAASKMHIPVAHVEAGLRSFNMRMPEEINRIISDRISNYLFCPTRTAVGNLNNEGITNGVYNVGDVMYDNTLYYRDKAKQQIHLSQWDVEEGQYALCTIHRAENTDNTSRLESILEALREIASDMPVLLPIHPRTKKTICSLGKDNWLNGIHILNPLPYLETLRLEMSAKVILTDSGGIQKEAFFHQVPCITMRDETEWVETVELGCNKLVGADKNKILSTFEQVGQMKDELTCRLKPYGEGLAAQLIISKFLNLELNNNISFH
jgi:UDP-GlcNAc3NAcA epimerase